ncbi:MAG: DUF2807 domain-containing protein [Patescibacteria group bacterium]
MKKALQITLSGSLFTIEEDAFERLRNYLDSIKAYFSKIPDSQDVVEDIEARISEQLLENIQNHNNIVTINDVDNVMKSMGSIEEISGSTPEDKKKQTPEESTSPRKLYRNGDDAVIAGVASGMAAYFNLDPLIMRIIFIILALFTSGGFVIVYIILALIIPKAVTAADKVKMRGGPVTLSSFKNTLEDQVDTMKANGADLVSKGSPIRTWLEKTFRFLGSIVRLIGRIALKVLGVLLTLIPVFICIGLIFAAINLIFTVQSPYVDFPITQVIPIGLYYLFVIIAFLAIFIPALFAASLGFSLLTGKRKMSGPTAMTLGGIWIVTILLAGTLALRYVPEIQQKVQALPEYRETSRTFDQKDFSKLDLHGVNKVTVVQSDTYMITAEGRQIDVDSSEFNVKDGILSVSHRQNENVCFLCFGNRPLEITIAMPTIESITASDVVSLSGKNIQSEALAITIGDAASADLGLGIKNLQVELKDIGRLTLHGTSTDLKLSQSDASRFDGHDYVVESAKVTTNGVSRTHIRASSSLEVTAIDASRVIYEGATPVIHQRDAARVTNESDAD